jgi:hypothetical protein
MKKENPLIHLELSIDEVNLILNALGQLPYVQVVTTLENLRRQAEGQLTAITQVNGNHK